jgi:GLPGLI family protein
MRYLLCILILGCILSSASAQTRVVAECTVSYTIAVSNELQVDKDAVALLKQSTKTVYIKGNNSRSDLNSPSFSQSLIYNKTTGNAVILREIGANKFLTKLSATDWVKQNDKFSDMLIQFSDERKEILGYDCKKATIQLKDGSTFSVFYASAIAPSVKEFEFQFKDIPGFVLEYEAKDGYTQKITYTATKISLNPVPASRFEIPVTGYRLLNE